MARHIFSFIRRQLSSEVSREKRGMISCSPGLRCYNTVAKPYVYEDISIQLVKNYSQDNGSIVIRPFLKVCSKLICIYIIYIR